MTSSLLTSVLRTGLRGLSGNLCKVDLTKAYGHVNGDCMDCLHEGWFRGQVEGFVEKIVSFASFSIW